MGSPRHNPVAKIMATTSTIRVAPALAAVAVVRDFGLDPAAILTEAGWSSELLKDPEYAWLRLSARPKRAFSAFVA
jgi:hypothetical protein